MTGYISTEDRAGFYAGVAGRGQAGLLAGPFVTREQAETMVEPARSAAMRVGNPADIHGLGTTRITAADTQVLPCGRLNEPLGLLTELPAPPGPRDPATIAKLPALLGYQPLAEGHPATCESVLFTNDKTAARGVLTRDCSTQTNPKPARWKRERTCLRYLCVDCASSCLTEGLPSAAFLHVATAVARGWSAQVDEFEQHGVPTISLTLSDPQADRRPVMPLVQTALLRYALAKGTWGLCHHEIRGWGLASAYKVHTVVFTSDHAATMRR